MKPPYEVNPEILRLISQISEKIGMAKANYAHKPSPELRKRNRIQTIHASLQIEGNTLTEEQITALLDKKRVIGPKKDVTEVLNAIEVYQNVERYSPKKEESFLLAHQQLMKNLVKHAGTYRKQSVGIVKGSQVAHVAPSFKNVPYLMKDLFSYLKESREITLIKSCVFHYEMEFIHPFSDGNGRMGRLWQTLILMEEYPVFQFLPLETNISKDQESYYKALAQSDQVGKSTPFIEYMLHVIDLALGKILDFNNRTLSQRDRLDHFISLGLLEFSRKDYMDVFKNISSATASRDLKNGVQLNLFYKIGTKNKTIYRLEQSFKKNSNSF
ncbi:MAG: Fic family protein [Bacteroidota bacterium]